MSELGTLRLSNPMSNHISNGTSFRQGKNDCVIVSIANFLRVDYSLVIQKLYQAGGMDAIQRLPKTGVTGDNIRKILKSFTNQDWQFSTPRRGQENFIGFASWHRPNRKRGHLNILICGKIKDTDGREYTIEEYRKTYNYVLRGIYHF